MKKLSLIILMLGFIFAAHPWCNSGLWAEEAGQPGVEPAKGKVPRKIDPEKLFEKTYKAIMEAKEIEEPRFFKKAILWATGKKDAIMGQIRTANEELRKAKEEMSRLKEEMAANRKKIDEATLLSKQAVNQKQLELAGKIKSEVSAAMKEIGESLKKVGESLKTMEADFQKTFQALSGHPLLKGAKGVFDKIGKTLGKTAKAVDSMGKSLVEYSEKSDLSAKDFAAAVNTAKMAWKNEGKAPPQIAGQAGTASGPESLIEPQGPVSVPNAGGPSGSGSPGEAVQTPLSMTQASSEEEGGVGAPTSSPEGAIGGKPYALEGYDHNKLNNPLVQSVKYKFGRIAQKYSLDPVHDHQTAQQLLEKMVPEFRAAGIEVKEVKKDKILVKTEIGWEWVDVVRGAGAPNPGWWWGSEGKPVDGGSTSPSSGGAPPGGSPPGGSPSGPPSGPPPSGSPKTGGAAGKPLQTVPERAEYANAPIDTSSVDKAVVSAASWVKQTRPDLFVEGDDRDKAYEMMTVLIAGLRAKGYDAHRVVNHPSRPIGHSLRYGSDAVVINGVIYDCYGGLGDPNRSTPQALNVGPYAAGRERE